MVSVALQRFPVEKCSEDAPVCHYVVHKRADDDPTSDLASDAIILFVGTVPVSIPPEPDENQLRFYMQDRSAYKKVEKWLPEFLQLDVDTAKKLVPIVMSGKRSEAAAYEHKYAHFLDLVLPGRYEYILAFRLFCEARDMCKNAPAKAFGDLTIHAPQTIGDWLGPFPIEGADDGAKISSLARMMGKDNEDGAKAVLNAVKEEPQDQAKIILAVQTYLGTLNTPPNQA